MKNTLIFIFTLIFPSIALAEQRLTIVSPHWEGIRYEIGEAFCDFYKRKTGHTIKINWLDLGGTSDILRYVNSEFSRNQAGIGIDIFFGGGTDPYFQLEANGFLEEHILPQDIDQKIGKVAAGIPLHSSRGYYFSPVMAAFGFMCNSEVLRRLNYPTPQTWQELANPEYKSWIGSADPRKSGSIHMVYETLLQAYGWDEGWKLIYKLIHNMRTISPSSAQVQKDISSGEVACGFAIDSYAWSEIKNVGATNISFTSPNDARVVNGDAIAVFKGAPHSALAHEFINFTFSSTAQRIFYYKLGSPNGPKKYELSRLPVLPDIYNEVLYSAIQINPFKWEPSFNYDSNLGARRWDLVNDLFNVFVTSRQDFLHNNLVTDPPIPESELNSLMDNNSWSDPAKRAEIMAKWSRMRKNTPTVWLIYKLLPLFIIIGLTIARALLKTNSGHYFWRPR